MKTFAVERSLKGLDMDTLGRALRAAIAKAAEMTAAGTPLSYMHSVPHAGGWPEPVPVPSRERRACRDAQPGRRPLLRPGQRGHAPAANGLRAAQAP